MKLLRNSPVTVLCVAAILHGSAAADSFDVKVLDQLLEEELSTGEAELMPSVAKRPINDPNRLAVELGGIRKQFVAQSTPLDYPIHSLGLAKALRKHGLPHFDAKTTEAVAAIAARAAAEQIEVIAEHTGDQDLLSRLKESRRTLESDVQLLLAASRPADRVVLTSPRAAGMFKVALSTSPKQGKQYYTTSYKYHILKKIGRLAEPDEWYEAFGDVVFLGGNFYFRARWPAANKQVTTGKVEVKRAMEIVLRAD